MNANKNIIELIRDCNYNNSYKDYIMKILIELSSQKNSIFYKTVLPHSQNKIIAIKYPLKIKLKGNSYEVKLTIYIPIDFPERAPEIFIDNNNDPLLAANPKNSSVNPDNFRVTTSKLYNWAKFTSIQEVLNEVINSFEQNFPIYKKKPNQSNVSPNQNHNNDPNRQSMNPNTNFNQNNYSAPINNNNFNNNFNNNNNKNWVGGNHNNNQGCPPIHSTPNNTTQNTNLSNVTYPPNNRQFFSNNFNNNFSNNHNSSLSGMEQNKNKIELDIKKAIIEEIRSSCESRIKDEVKRLRSQEDKLNNYKQVFLSQNEKLKMNLDKKSENENTLSILKNEIENDIQSIQNFLINLTDQNLNKDNCFNFVNIKDKEGNLMKILSMEATIEDMYLIIKRAFEKGAINFNDTIRFIRNLSREAVKIKFVRDKILKKHDKNYQC